CEHPGGFGIRKSASNSGHSPLRGLGVGLGGGLVDASPARRGSRSRPPLRRPRPLRFERLPVPVWNPYSRGRLSPAKSEDRKGGEGKTDANLTIFFSTCCAWHPNSPPRPGEAPHPAPSARKSVIRLHRKLPSAPPGSTQEVSESENRPATRGTAHSEV